MLCPQCNEEMKDKSHYEIDISLGPEPDYDTHHKVEYHRCTKCKINYIDGIWSIPEWIRKPTAAQLRGILTVNKYLCKNYEAFTFAQAHRILSKWLDIALSAKADYEERYGDDEYIDFDPLMTDMDSD